jgi:hypothetical protein
VEGISPIGTGNILFHESLDSRRTLDGSESTNPFPIFREEPRIRREIAGIEEAAVIEQDVLDFPDIFEPLDTRDKRLVILLRGHRKK